MRKKTKKAIHPQVRVGGFDYKVKFTKLTPERNGFQPVGLIDFDDRTISLDPRYITDEEVYFSLFHEIIHASIEACVVNYSVKDINDDKLIHPLSRILWDGLKSAGIVDKKWMKR